MDNQTNIPLNDLAAQLSLIIIIIIVPGISKLQEAAVIWSMVKYLTKQHNEAL